MQSKQHFKSKRDLGPRIQDIGPETQGPQNRTDDLELSIEDLGPDICDYGLAFILPTVWTFLVRIIFVICKNPYNKFVANEMGLILEFLHSFSKKEFCLSIYCLSIYLFNVNLLRLFYI